jgi:hypothetical protein
VPKIHEGSRSVQVRAHMRQKPPTDLLSRASITLPLLGVILAIVGFFLADPGAARSRADEAAAAAAQREARLLEEVRATQEELRAMKVQLQALSRPNGATALGAQLAATQKSVAGLSRQVSDMQTAIGSTPAKALAVPLLQRDIEAMRTSGTASLEAMQADLDRQVDLMKWLLGTFVLGMLGIVATSITSARKDGSAGPQVNGRSELSARDRHGDLGGADAHVDRDGRLRPRPHGGDHQQDH